MSELCDADFIEDANEILTLTEEGKDVLAMFGDAATPVAQGDGLPQASYAVYDEGNFRVYQKRVDDVLVFSLALSGDAFEVNLPGETDEAQVEELIRRFDI